MKQIKCPKCGKRAFDIGGIMQKTPVVIELKCPNCRNIVKVTCEKKSNE